MVEIRSQNLHAGNNWPGDRASAAGLYGELPPLPVPAATGLVSVQARKSGSGAARSTEAIGRTRPVEATL